MAREGAEERWAGSEQAVEPRHAVARELYAKVRARLLTELRTPLSTYRVQFNQQFQFKDAERLLPYLDRLGISDLYASPYFKASPGSTHGYDVIDHLSLNPEVGTEDEHASFCAALRKLGMGQLLDVVPNHMGIERGNALWQEVLENGPASLYAKFFDIDWDPVKDELKDKVLLPILGDQYGVVLEKGELRLHYENGTFGIRYYDVYLPVNPRQYGLVLRHQLGELEKELGGEDASFIELQSILTAIEYLPTCADQNPAARIERNREKKVIKRRLASLTSQSAKVLAFVQRNVGVFNGTVGDPRSFDLLDKLLAGCSFRLAHWRVAGEEINYRRFFDINALAAIRVEEPEVFQQAHGLVFRLLREGKVNGLRIDHPDGLFDPTSYFLNLQEAYFLEQAHKQWERELPGESAAWPDIAAIVSQCFREEMARSPDSPLRRCLYVVVEKIQGGRERIPEDWAVHGTVGYRFANAVTGLFVDRENEQIFNRIYQRFTDVRSDYRELLYDKKKLILSISMSSEVNVLARELNRISEMNRRTRDFTLNALRRALVEFIALFPVYRTYVDSRAAMDERDLHYIEWTIARAKEKNPTTNASIYDFLRDILLKRYPDFLNDTEKGIMLRFAMKLQQVTGPVMAKGLEDTVFYIYNRLTSLNEVGGEPERFGIDVATFHLRNQERVDYWPNSLLASSTHDTKRSEDVRARISVLSEIPKDWNDAATEWGKNNRRFKAPVAGKLAPSANDEYLFYQAMLGAWPVGERTSKEEFETFRKRLGAYMEKAVHEAKVHTSWTNPDAHYDAAVQKFVKSVLDEEKNSEFIAQALALKRKIEPAGYLNALSAVILKLVSPGTPDFYQGTELWDLSLVDPDNRRPVDFKLRKKLLEELDARVAKDRESLCAELWSQKNDGRVKLFVTSQGLRYRRARRELFQKGSYLPLSIEGPMKSCAIALARAHGQEGLVAVVPRFFMKISASGGLPSAMEGTDVLLPDAFARSSLRDVLTGRVYSPREGPGGSRLSLGELFALFPLALLDKQT